jgi:hypothetical protein
MVRSKWDRLSIIPYSATVLIQKSCEQSKITLERIVIGLWSFQVGHQGTWGSRCIKASIARLKTLACLTYQYIQPTTTLRYLANFYDCALAE